MSLFLLPVLGTTAFGQPGFSKSFLPSTIGPGSTSRLMFVINNVERPPAEELAFTDTLPAEVTIADPAGATNSCGGILSAPAGGMTLSLSGGRVGANAICEIGVNVTSSTPGGHMNVSGDLTSTAGNSGAATATLTVDGARPGFSKTFSPATIPLGGTSTLTFIVDNGGGDIFQLQFLDNLPAGMVVANPANAATDCSSTALPATLTAIPGTAVISLLAQGFQNDPVLGAESTCSVTVDVTTTANGLFANISGELLVGQSGDSSGFATAALDVPVEFLVKSFIDDPVPPGGAVTLQFTVTNLDRNQPATAIAFDDDLESVLSGLTPAEALPKAACGGTLGFSSGILSLTGGSLPAAGSCTFSVELTVPVAAAAGTYTNTAGPISAEVSGDSVVGNTATDKLVVSTVPILAKEFVDDPAAAGGSVTLRFTITNTSPDSDLTNIAFTDDLNTAIPGLAANSLVSGMAADPLLDICGMGSELTVFDPPDIPLPPPSPPIVTPPDPTQLIFTGGNLAPAGSEGDSCTFDVVLDVPAGTPGGTYVNTTSDVTGVIDTCGDGCLETLTGLSASGDLVIVGAPRLLKEFTNDPVLPGGTVTLQFTLSHSAFAPGDASAVTFTDDLAATLPGLTATGLPQADLCGPGNGTMTGSAMDTMLTLSGVTLAPGETCMFSVTLNVPDPAAAGSYPNTTSSLAATVDGVPGVTGNPASDDLQIAGLTIAKEFIDDPALPGDTVTLRFMLNNQHPADNATGIFFSDNLGGSTGALPGLTAEAPLPDTASCGAGSSLDGTTLLTFIGGSLNAGTSCSFDVTLRVPAGAADDTYNNVTGAVSATLGDSSFTGDPATDLLTVDSSRLLLAKSFTDDPVAPGGTVNLHFEITNLDTSNIVTDIAFTDDLNAALTGLTAIGLPIAACGGTVSGTDIISLAGGSLGPGATCSFDVPVSVPAGAPLGSVSTNTSSPVTGLIGDLGVSGDPATDDLTIEFVIFTKAFDGPTGAGGTASLTFTLHNLDTVNPVSSLSFSDDLNAALAGLAALGLPISNPCGTGSQISGTSFLTFLGGTLPAGGMCEFSVPLQIPAGAAPGVYTNTTSSLTSGGLPVSGPATADLTIEGPPLFDKGFSPALIAFGFNSVLAFTIDNSGNSGQATNLAFTDNLPAGLVVAILPNTTNTCGGAVTAVSGSSLISLSGGTLAGGASCVVQVTVTATAVGAMVNTSGPLTSSLGNSGVAQDTLTVIPASPILTKSFIDDPLRPGDLGTLSFTIVNPNSTEAATGIAFTDDLNATLPGLIASDVGGGVDSRGDPLPVDNPCGVGSQITGGPIVTLTGGTRGPGESCTFIVRILVPTGAAPGLYPNLTSPVTSMVDGVTTEGPGAEDTLEIEAPPAEPLEIIKTTSTPQVVAGSAATFSISVRNIGTSTLTNVSVDDPLSPNCNRSIGDLLASAGFSYSCQSPALTADLTNEATATATPPTGEPFSVSDTAFVEVVPPSIAIEKVAVTPQVDEGQSGTFMITITNLTDGALTGLVVADPLTPDCARDPGLLPDLPATGSTDYTCTTEALFATLTNTATVTADGGIHDTDSATVEVINLISIAKEPGEQQIDAGDTALFTITIHNPGAVERTDITISDPLTPDCDRLVPSLDAGETLSYDCQLDSVFSSFTNVATLSVEIEGQTVTRTAPALVTVRNPEAEILKVAAASVIQPGERATFTITINNISNSVKTDLQVTDPLTPDCERSAAQLGDLPVGGTISYTCQTEPLFADLTNVATLTGTVASTPGAVAAAASRRPQQPGQTFTAVATAVVTVASPVIEIDKTATETQINPGETAEFTITIRNTGTQDISNIAVSDPLTPACDATLTGLVLTPGDETFYSCVTDPLNSDLTNTATVTATVPTGDPVSASDSATVQVGYVPVGLESIPTLSEVGMAALFCLLLAAGLWMMSKRRGSEAD